MESLIITALLFAAFVGVIYLVTRDSSASGDATGSSGGGDRDTPGSDTNHK